MCVICVPSQHPSAVIGKGCKIGPNVVIGPDVVIEDGKLWQWCCYGCFQCSWSFCAFYSDAGVCMSRTTVQEGSKVMSHALVQSTIIGWESTIGKWVSQWQGIKANLTLLFTVIWNHPLIEHRQKLQALAIILYSSVRIPYSGNFSQGPIFVVFTVDWQTAKL